jgi:hypothetical protein
MKRVIHIQTCRNVLFVGKRRKVLIIKKLACMVQRFNNNARERNLRFAQLFGKKKLKGRFRVVQANCLEPG